MMMEACSGGDMDGMGEMTPGVRAKLLYETINGIMYLHSQGIVHSDIKPENVMLSGKCNADGSSCNAKVADFGVSCDINKLRDCNGAAGTPYYISPEMILTGRRHKSDDLWAV